MVLVAIWVGYLGLRHSGVETAEMAARAFRKGGNSRCGIRLQATELSGNGGSL